MVPSIACDLVLKKRSSRIGRQPSDDGRLGRNGIEVDLPPIVLGIGRIRPGAVPPAIREYPANPLVFHLHIRYKHPQSQWRLMLYHGQRLEAEMPMGM
ncbi:MAG TPA: hypothetical protein DCZ69_02200 [Syntrophobacteraceae bacterium]|nr:hypothetical protein [Syntrophobacteraceae bacterium]